jgi:hypothetical protein
VTGPEHYREAELAISAAAYQYQDWAGREGNLRDAMRSSRWHLDLAAVHATLALAAAIVDGPAVMRPEDRDDWDRATGRTS